MTTSRSMDPVPAVPGWPGRHAVFIYFLLTFSISWFSAFLLVARHFFRHQPIPKFTGLMMFPVMLIGPSLSGIYSSHLFTYSGGLRDLFVRLSPSRIAPRWLPVLLIPPVLVVTVLFWLNAFYSSAFAPNHFFTGAAFGVVAGFFEELGWTGFALPRMLTHAKSWVPPAILLGILWSCWHIPVIDYLGTATPHGYSWLRYFLAFTAAMTAIRVLIAWVYVNTQSILFAQLLHASSTASLVVFSPTAVSARQEVFWYSIYAAAIWLLILLLFVSGVLSGRNPHRGYFNPNSPRMNSLIPSLPVSRKQTSFPSFSKSM